MAREQTQEQVTAEHRAVMRRGQREEPGPAGLGHQASQLGVYCEDAEALLQVSQQQVDWISNNKKSQ